MEENKEATQEVATESKILQVGDSIKPLINEEMARAMAERLYGISCLEIKELNSYDDKNYKITEDPNMKNPLITNHWPHGYVLKVMNSMDSQKLSFVEAQTEAMIYLAQHQINCPKPIRNVYGHYFSLEKLPNGKSHVVRLLEFQPGEILLDVPRSEFLFYQMGEYIANLDRLLKGFNHSGFVDHKHIWQLDNVPELDKFKDAVKDAEFRTIIDQVLEEFKNEVIPKIPKLEKGLIHGDFNEQNIVVNQKEQGNPDSWRITALIDFGDTSLSCYLFELSITMAYAMLLTGDLKTGGLVIAGYSIVRIIPEKEYKLLRICVAARLCQSLILGAYSHQQDPKNTYMLCTQKSILKLLPILWKEAEDDVIAQWKSVADDYLTRSSR